MGAPATALANAARDTVKNRSSFFHTFLADQPEYLVPERLILSDRQSDADESLKVNPNVWFSWRDELPSSISELYPLPDKFLPEGDFIWVEDPATRLQRPFWAGPWFQEKLAAIQQDAPAPNLSSQHRSVLYQAGVLIRPEESARRSVQWQQALRQAAATFQTEDYVSLHGLIHPFHIGSLRRYYRHVLRTGGMTLGDNCSAGRYVAYDEPIASFFHHQLTGVVTAIAGVRVKPSFAYVASYPGGTDLPIHTDREQCEYAISCLIDYTPEPMEQSPWPLYLETCKGTVPIWQSLGDAVLYRGRTLSHYRNPLPWSSTSTSIFFYYVDDRFEGPLA